MLTTVILKARDKHKALFDGMLMVLIGSITVVMLLVIFSTVVAAFFPASPVNAHLFARRTVSGTVFEYIASFNTSTRIEARISRELVHKSTGQAIQLPYSERLYSAGQQYHHQLYPIPEVAMPGEWCMKYTVRWRPSWSLVDKIQEREMSCTYLEPLMG